MGGWGAERLGDGESHHRGGASEQYQEFMSIWILLASWGPCWQEGGELAHVEHLVCIEKSSYLIGTCCIQGKDFTYGDAARQGEGMCT